jgi:hypothetical protein
VWCHQALEVEAALDRNDGTDKTWTGWSQQADRARQEIRVAARFIHTGPDKPDPREWAQLARHAAALRKEVQRKLAARQVIENRMSPIQSSDWSPRVPNPAELRGPDLGV